ncbi:MAG: transcriptional regulator [Acidimicrobiia bacterium]
MADTISKAIGRRLRAIRRQKGLSLQDVERQSGGRWNPSTLGAYERGFRKLTVERLRDLAEFYGVPLSLLLGSLPHPDRPVSVSRVVLDITKLEEAGLELAPFKRMVRALLAERREEASTLVAIRRSDIRNAALMYGETEEQLLARLKARGILVDLDRTSVEREAQSS